MRIQVLVRLKNGVLDVQGKAVENGLHELDFGDVAKVRIGKLIEFDVKETNLEQAKQRVDQMCQLLLVNSIIENYEIKGA